MAPTLEVPLYVKPQATVIPDLNSAVETVQCLHLMDIVSKAASYHQGDLGDLTSPNHRLTNAKQIMTLTP